MSEPMLLINSCHKVRKVWTDGKLFVGSSRRRAEEMGQS